jgi:CPA1 family monovalent cation:H+ antiporter
MARETLFFWALLAVFVLSLVARWMKKPEPIVFVIGGLALGFLPGVPRFDLPPDLVFLLLLPPLLFSNAWSTDYRDFIRWRRPILRLAFGLVVFTTIVVAYVAHLTMGIPLAAAFVLGAVLSPTDAVGVDAVAKEVALPRAIVAITGGESLVNDASALVIFAFALGAVVTGTFSPLAAVGQLLYVAVVGIGIGLACGWGLARFLSLMRRGGLLDDQLTVIYTLITPYIVYLLAQGAHASGVLSAVAAGFYLSRRSTTLFAGGDEQVALFGFWTVFNFFFNGVAFLLIGLQFRSVIAGIEGHSIGELVRDAAVLCVLLVALRLVWGFASILPWRLRATRAERDDGPPLGAIVLISWAGIRGIVTLAAALAIPAQIRPGVPFPDRDLIVFAAFCVIVFSLVVQGGTLGWLARTLGLTDDAESDDVALRAARAHGVRAALERLAELETGFTSTLEWEIAGRLRESYMAVLEAMSEERSPDTPAAGERAHVIEARMRRDLLEAERAGLHALRADGTTRESIVRDAEWFVILAESRLGPAPLEG